MPTITLSLEPHGVVILRTEVPLDSALCFSLLLRAMGCVMREYADASRAHAVAWHAARRLGRAVPLLSQGKRK